MIRTVNRVLSYARGKALYTIINALLCTRDDWLEIRCGDLGRGVRRMSDLIQNNVGSMGLRSDTLNIGDSLSRENILSRGRLRSVPAPVAGSPKHATFRIVSRYQLKWCLLARLLSKKT